MPRSSSWRRICYSRLRWTGRTRRLISTRIICRMRKSGVRRVTIPVRRGMGRHMDSRAMASQLWIRYLSWMGFLNCCKIRARNRWWILAVPFPTTTATTSKTWAGSLVDLTNSRNTSLKLITLVTRTMAWSQILWCSPSTWSCVSIKWLPWGFSSRPQELSRKCCMLRLLRCTRWKKCR